MKKSLLSIVTLSLLVASTSSFAAQVAPSPLIGPEFSEGKGQARVEAVYINYENVYGGGVQGAKRFALSDTFALMPSLGVYHLTGDHSYTDAIAGQISHDMDYTFASGGLRAEVQKKFEPVNFILFGGALFHYGESKDTTTATDPTIGIEHTKSTDKGLGWEAGIQAAMKTGPIMTTLFYKYDVMRVDTDNKDNSGTAVANQKFTFKNSTVGIDLLFANGVSLSALYGMLDQPQGEDGQDVDITIIKLGYSF
jgi:hypothetical protein